MHISIRSQSNMIHIQCANNGGGSATFYTFIMHLQLNIANLYMPVLHAFGLLEKVSIGKSACGINLIIPVIEIGGRSEGFHVGGEEERHV